MSEQLDLAAIEARCSKATPGPWRANYWKGVPDRVMEPGGTTVLRASSTGLLSMARVDLDFVVAAREDVPALLARVRALEAEVAALEPDARLGRAVRQMRDNTKLARYFHGYGLEATCPEEHVCPNAEDAIRVGTRPEAALGLEGSDG
jgi:hypothetical protein